MNSNEKRRNRRIAVQLARERYLAELKADPNWNWIRARVIAEMWEDTIRWADSQAGVWPFTAEVPRAFPGSRRTH